MTVHYSDDHVVLHHGDCLDVLSDLADVSVDAMVTDPPYLLGFMGREWDTRAAHKHLDWHLAWCREALRVLKPGGHLLAFGGTRTWHRLACAVEDAGFEIRDSITWLYGAGFPKSLDVSKAIDKAAGAEREVTSEGRPVRRMIPGADQNRTGSWVKDDGREYTPTETAAATEDARTWDGWGTALKPAHEPIVVARKPLSGTVVATVLEHGTGALNIDGCRICDEAMTGWHRDARDEHVLAHRGREGETSADRRYTDAGGTNFAALPGVRGGSPAGRWPANVVLDEHTAGLVDEQSGVLTSGANPARRSSDKFRDAYGDFRGQEQCVAHRGTDSGGASRFFYVSKASAGERPRVNGVAHPTVKPLALMRWLVRLVTPPGGTVLDPFAGSGTTAEACLLEGFDCIAVEAEADYLPLIMTRLTKPMQVGFDLGVG